ncbi:MAG TPA: MFS transporter [Ignavibacteriales bacterium]|nr:MFS transporter [Ignavibacteriales bacterium]
MKTTAAKNYFKNIGVNRAVLALSFARMADAIGNSILFIIIPLYVAKLPEIYFHLPLPILVGILISAYGLISALVQPLTGALSDKLNKRKPLIQTGLVLISFSTLAFILADNFIDLLLLRILQGIAVAITIPASMSLMALITKKKTRGGSMGVYSMLRMVGFATGPLIGGYLQTHYGFNSAFIAGSGFIFIAMLLVQIWVKEVVTLPDKHQKKIKIKIIDSSLLTPGLVSAALSIFLMASAFSIVTTLENEFNAKLNMDALGFASTFSALIFSRLIFQIPLGHYSDKIGRKPFIVLGLIIMAPATLLLGEVVSVSQLIFLRLVQGFAAAAIAAPAFAVAADLSRSGKEGRQMSLVTTGFGLGLAAGPLIAGFLSVFFFELPFITVGAMTLAGAWIVYHYLPETIEGAKVVVLEKRK